MNPKTYNRSANVCVVIAMISALLFEQSGGYYWIPGLFAIASGLTAAGIYFYNQRNASDVRMAS